MNTIQQTVHISADRRLRLDLTLPDNFPVGEAELRVFSPQSKGKTYEAIKHLAGCLAGSKTLAENSLAIQRSMRDEW
jgi:hypothetical protein